MSTLFQVNIRFPRMNHKFSNFSAKTACRSSMTNTFLLENTPSIQYHPP